jgi:hypothetical protein
MELPKRIFQLGNVYKDRLDQERLNYALDYVNFNEWTIAFETVCDELCEYDVPITQSEYGELMELGSQLKADLSAGRFRYLKHLIKAPH